MFRRARHLSMAVLCATCFAVAAEKTPSPAKLSAADIAAHNVAARGGLQAWRSVQTITMTGKLEAGGNNRSALPVPGRKDNRFMPPARPVEQVRLPFVMDLKRPRKVRVNLQFRGQNAVQVFDGSRGWKLRPFLNRHEVEPYTEEELKSAESQADLDGPLIDYAEKGTRIDLVGTDKVEGHDTYRLRLNLKSGKTTDIWIDATTFLEAKIEGTPRRLDGRPHPVEVYYRDYRNVNGLKIPFALETRVLSAPDRATAGPVPGASEQILLEKVDINPKLDDALFTRADLDKTPGGKPAITTATVSTGR